MAERPRSPRRDNNEGPPGDRPRGPRPDSRDRRRGSPDWKPRRSPGSPGAGPPPYRAGGGAPRGDAQRPFDRPRPSDRPRPFDRPQRKFEDRPRRDFSDRPRRDFTDRPPRDDADRPRFDDRPKADFSDRPKREFADRPPRRDFSDRPPRRDFADRPPRRDFGDRPPRREEGERPQRTFEDRPQRYQGPGPRPERRFDRPRPGYGRPVGSFDSRRPRIAAASGASEQIGENEELIAGKRPVEEAFAARRAAIRLLIVPERRAALDALAIHATTLRIPVVEVEGGSLTALAGFDGHQGVALVVQPRAQSDVDGVLAHARGRNAPPFVLVLDSLEDPQNFGTLLRSAEACGVDGVIYPTRRAAPLTPAAIKASAGATEHLLLAPVDDLAGTLADLHAEGLRIVGADESASLSYAEADLRGPLVLVVGSEGKGMSGPVKRRLDLAVRIPMQGKIGSLNAAVAGSILLFAAAQQRPIAAAEPAEPTSEKADSTAPAEAEAKPKRKAATKKSEPKPAKPAAKPRKTVIRMVKPEALDEGLLPEDV